MSCLAGGSLRHKLGCCYDTLLRLCTIRPGCVVSAEATLQSWVFASAELLKRISFQRRHLPLCPQCLCTQVLEEMEQEKVPYDDMTHTIIVDSMIVKRHAKEAIAYTLQLKEDKIRSALQQDPAQGHGLACAHVQLKEDKSR